MFTGGNPVLLGGRVDLEDVGPCTEDGLLSVHRKEKAQRKRAFSIELQDLKSLKYAAGSGRGKKLEVAPNYINMTDSCNMFV